jgi:hypothetical protein
VHQMQNPDGGPHSHSWSKVDELVYRYGKCGVEEMRPCHALGKDALLSCTVQPLV